MKNIRVGDPHINLCLAVLGKAKEEPRYFMWEAFRQVYNKMSKNYDPMQVAEWVSERWAGYEKPEEILLFCPQCQIQTYVQKQRCDICESSMMPKSLEQLNYLKEV